MKSIVQIAGYHGVGLILIATCAVSGRTAAAQDMQLFAQSSAAALERQFDRSELSWLLLDGSGRILVKHWQDAKTPVAPGSLVKPFLAVAYGEQHAFVFPREFCSGTRGHCWLPKGHGWLGLEDAVAQSCNAYFLALASDLDYEQAMRTVQRLGLHGPSPGAPTTTWIGLGAAWKETPMAIARAYLSLIAGSATFANNRILYGMQLAAQTGTAREIDTTLRTRDAAAKTGTAVCTHNPHGAADGFAVVVYPAGSPRVLLLVRMHGGTGAQTAGVAGAMLRSIGVGEK